MLLSYILILVIIIWDSTHSYIINNKLVYNNFIFIKNKSKFPHYLFKNNKSHNNKDNNKDNNKSNKHHNNTNDTISKQLWVELPEFITNIQWKSLLAGILLGATFTFFPFYSTGKYY